MTRYIYTVSYFVSTHSRLKAAGWRCLMRCRFCRCFNTQPPEGGWLAVKADNQAELTFQHTAA